MPNRKPKNEQKPFDEGLNHSIQSAEDSGDAAARSRSLRTPLCDPEVEGPVTKGLTRPNWVKQAMERLSDLTTHYIKEAGDWLRAKEREAADIPRPWLYLLVSLALVGADGLFQGPMSSNALGGFEGDFMVFALGLAVSFILALAGWAIGWTARSIHPGGWSKLLAAVLSFLLGAAAGAALGQASDEATFIVLVRMVFSSMGALSMCILHFAAAKSWEAWGPVRTARRQLRAYEKERDQLQKRVDAYQKSTREKKEAFNKGEADRQDGLKSGEQARKEWVRPSYKNFLLSLVLLVTGLFAPPQADADETAQVLVVIDVTDSVEADYLKEAALQNLDIHYGDSVRVLLLGCTGLTPVFEGVAPRRSVPRHRQALAALKDDLAKAVRTAQPQAGDTKCSPVAESLLLLAGDIQLAQAYGKPVRLLVASDFQTNSGKTSFTGEPFAGVKVTAVLSRSRGRDVKGRLAALDFLKRLFAKAMLRVIS